MASHYKLLFRGAVHADQHVAVVRPRLQTMLKASDAQMDLMFSGKAVTIKKSVNEATAEKYVDAFFNAGAKLELVEAAAPATASATASATESVSESEPVSETDPQTNPSEPLQTPPQGGSTGESGGFQLAAVGTNLVAPSERHDKVEPEVATDHLSLANPGTTLGAEKEASEHDEIVAVDTSHLQLDQPGVRLGQPETEVVDAEQLLNFDFELGEVGETLVESRPAADPVLPDLSHLQLEAVALAAEDELEARD